MRILFNIRSKKNEKLITGLSSNTLKRDIIRTSFALLGLCIAHTLAMMAFEGLSAEDSFWLTLTTATTVGYGDMSAETLYGRLSTIILMYAAGIAILAQLASLYFDLRQHKTDSLLNGKWRWTMDDHIVFLNAPERDPVGYFLRFMAEFRKSALPAARKSAIIVSPDFSEALGDDLRSQGIANVNYDVASPKAFEHSSLSAASHIVIISRNDTDPVSDSISYDLIARAREANPNAIIIAEAVLDDNKDRLFKAGANHVIRPIRSYPELLIRTILAPGAEDIIADIFDTKGEEIVRYNVPIKGKWGDIQCDLIKNDIGIPLAYVEKGGRAIASTTPADMIDAIGFIVLAREGNIESDRKIAKKLAA